MNSTWGTPTRLLLGCDRLQAVVVNDGHPYQHPFQAHPQAELRPVLPPGAVHDDGVRAADVLPCSKKPGLYLVPASRKDCRRKAVTLRDAVVSAICLALVRRRVS